jgi:hypothetical protein
MASGDEVSSCAGLADRGWTPCFRCLGVALFVHHLEIHEVRQDWRGGRFRGSLCKPEGQSFLNARATGKGKGKCEGGGRGQAEKDVSLYSWLKD